MRPAYEYHRLVLQLLQRRHPARTWVIKAPSHLAHLRLVLAMYLDARIVVCHRDPLAIPAAIAAHLAEKPAARAGQHQHSVDDLGLDLAAERRRFEPYMTEFGIPDEIDQA